MNKAERQQEVGKLPDGRALCSVTAAGGEQERLVRRAHLTQRLGSSCGGPMTCGGWRKPCQI